MFPLARDLLSVIATRNETDPHVTPAVSPHPLPVSSEPAQTLKLVPQAFITAEVNSVFVKYQGSWKCDSSALSAIHTLVEHRLHALLHSAIVVADHCAHEKLTATDVELALYLSGLWTQPTAPQVVKTPAAACGVLADSVVLTKSTAKPSFQPVTIRFRRAADDASKATQAQTQTQQLPRYFDERVRRFGVFYCAQFPEQLSKIEADYDEAGENVQTRMERERSIRGMPSDKKGWWLNNINLRQGYSRLIRFVRSHESLRCLVQVKRLACSFDNEVRSDPELFNTLYREIGKDYKLDLSYAVRFACASFCIVPFLLIVLV